MRKPQKFRKTYACFTFIRVIDYFFHLYKERRVHPVGHTNHPKTPQEGQLNPMKEQFRNLLASVQALKSEISDLKKVVETLESSSSDAMQRYVATCPACSTRYDMLAHHYSIGLFDNMVYVKCPKCNKGMPVQGGAGGGISAVADEESY